MPEPIAIPAAAVKSDSLLNARTVPAVCITMASSNRTVE